jgi:hypothetical protein
MHPTYRLGLALLAVVLFVPWIDFAVQVAHRPVRLGTVISHRGNGFGFTENTLAAVKAAHAHNFVVEIDVRVSAEGTPFMHHDATLDRTTPCTGKVRAKSDAELAACGVTTLAEVFVQTTGGLEVDIKDEEATRTAAAVMDASVGRELYVFPVVSSTHTEEVVAALFQQHRIIWPVADIDRAKRVTRVLRPDKDMFGVSLENLWYKGSLLHYVTQHSRNLDVWFTCDTGCKLDKNRWMVYSMPITHAEVDTPLSFESMDGETTMLGHVYRSSALGCFVAFVCGTVVAIRSGAGWRAHTVRRDYDKPLLGSSETAFDI